MERDTYTNFFISYTSADRSWAEWIAWQLEQAGYTTIIQAWDMQPGSNFVLEMDTAATAAERTIAVLSPDYFNSGFTPSEWAAAFRRDPKGERRLLVPVRVRECDVEGLLGPIVYLDLVEQNEQTACTRLLAGVRKERAKPTVPPAFPAVSHTLPERPVFPSMLFPFWNIPFRRNPFFTGREQLLTSLHDQLNTNKAATLIHAQAISGLGGIGKTQTALEYAYRYHEEYQAVFWVRAAALDTLIADFVSMARLLQLPEQDAADQQMVVAAVKRWLTTHGSWLLILDNADDLRLAAEFVPLQVRGHLLLTTRTQAPGSFARPLAVEKISQAEGTLLLLRRARRLAPDVPLEQARLTERSQAEVIVSALDGLPLALDQAGAYIEETACGLGAYIALYHQCSVQLLEHRASGSPDYPHTVTSTWSLAFQQVEQINPAAADLLRFCAFLDADAIPGLILSEGASHLGVVLRPVAADPLQRNEAIKALLAFSLVRRNPETQILTIHRLVQAVLKDRMEARTRRTWAVRTVKAVNAAFPQSDYATWAICQQCLPHALVCARLIEEYHLSLAEAASLLDKTASYLHEHAQYMQAEPLYQRALAIYEQVLSPNHPNIAMALDNLAILYFHQEHYEEAEPLYQRALAIYEQVLSPNHPNIAMTLDNLANLNRAQERYEEAEPLYQRALTIKENVLPPDHPETANTLGNLALLYYYQRRYEEAEPLYQRTLAIVEKALPPDHPNIANTLAGLALLYYHQGRYKEAEPLFQRALAIYEKALPPDHPSTATTLSNYASLLRKMTRPAEAQPLEQRAKAIRARPSSKSNR